jgi:hypothetical protein
MMSNVQKVKFCENLNVRTPVAWVYSALDEGKWDQTENDYIWDWPIRHAR